MSELVDVRGMSVNEYCSFVEMRALHLAVSPFELNIEYWERDLISMVKFDLAKAELLSRRMNGDLVEF